MPDRDGWILIVVGLASAYLVIAGIVQTIDWFVWLL